MEQTEQRRLRGAPCTRGRASRVESVLHDIEIQRAEVYRAEVDEPLNDNVKGEFVICGQRAADELLRSVQDPAVDLRQLGNRHLVTHGIKSGQVPQKEAAGVADAAIALEQWRDHCARKARIGGE